MVRDSTWKLDGYNTLTVGGDSGGPETVGMASAKDGHGYGDFVR